MKKFLLSFLGVILICSVINGQQHRPYRLSELNKNGIPHLLDGISTPEQWATKKEEIRKAWLDLVGKLPRRPQVQYKIISETQMSDHVRKKIIFNTIYNDTISAFLLIPNSAKTNKRKYPAMLALQPTNETGKLAVATPFKEGGRNRYYGYELVSRGYIVLAPDDLTSGERVFPGEKSFQSAPFYKKHPDWTIMAKTLVDHMQALDLLSQLDRVSADRIGSIGVSFGAYNSYFLSSVDPRIKVVVSICGLSPFTGDPNPNRWGIRDWYTHFPKITDDLKNDRVPFEFNEIVALSAPTPMFFYAAQNDRIFPQWKSIGDALNDVYKLYDWMGHPDNFEYSIGPGGHDFPPAIRNWAYDFLDKYLQNKNIR
jgi:hypothetical protein